MVSLLFNFALEYAIKEGPKKKQVGLKLNGTHQLLVYADDVNLLNEEKSEGERREVPTEEAAVKSSRVTTKRYRGRRIGAGRRVKPTKLARGECESRRKLVAACRKVSCRAAVAWRKRNLVRNIRTQGNCGPLQD
jgi:hypothetical protein